MKQLQALHEKFIQQARRPMSFGRLPVSPKQVELPVVPMNRWVNEGDPKRMTKTYQFRRPGDRNVFVRELLDYEEKEGHSADIFATESSVTLKLYTRDVNQITELDKEYSRFADSVYKDITMTPDKFSKSGD